MLHFHIVFLCPQTLPMSTSSVCKSKEFSSAMFFTQSVFTFRDSTLLIQVRWSKTIQFGQRVVTIPLVTLPSSDLCPVTAVSCAFALTSGSPPSNQAIGWWDSYYATYRVFTYCDFMACFKSHLSRSGSRGSMGLILSDVGILLLHWKRCSSRFMYLYLHMPLSQRLRAQQSISSYILSS